MIRSAYIRALDCLIAVLSATGVALATNGPVADARGQFEAGNYRQAAEILTAGIGRNPQEPELYYWLGRCYFELREYDRALSNAERAIQLEPQNSDYHHHLGLVYGRKAEQAGMFSAFSLAKKTRREFQEAVRLDPHNFQAQHDLIDFYLNAPGIVGGGDEKARQQAESLAVIDPIESYVGLGAYWAHKKNFQQAEAEYRSAFEARPKRVDVYFEIADFYQQIEKPAPMEEAVEAAARIRPNDRRLGYYRAVARILGRNRLSEAEEQLETYLARVPPRSDLPSHAWAHFWLGRLYELDHRCQEAAEQYSAALQVDSRNKSAHDALKHVCK